MNNKELGARGEEIAKSYLENKGLLFVAKNYKAGRKEIDLIFSDEKKKIVIFIEVKTRRNRNYGDPEESITLSKQKNIKFTAVNFISQNPSYNKYDLRFDSLSVMTNGEKININHIEEAF